MEVEEVGTGRDKRHVVRGRVGLKVGGCRQRAPMTAAAQFGAQREERLDVTAGAEGGEED